MRVKHLHSSGRYDRSNARVKRAMERYAKNHNLITLTEMHRRSRREDVLEMPGWTVVRYFGPGDGDPAVVVKDSDWVVVDKWRKRLTKHEQRRGPGGPPPPHALIVLLRERGGRKKVFVTVAHLPSHVEGRWFRRYRRRWYGRVYWRVFVWRRARRNWQRYVNRLRRRHHAKVMYVADWNLNFKRRRFRALAKAMFPALHLTWRKPFPRRGTHHRRIIDATITNLRVVRRAKLFRDDNSSDHRPYDEVLDL